MISLSLVLVFVTTSGVFGFYEDIFSSYKSNSDPWKQVKAAEGVIKRLLGSDQASSFNISIDENISENGMDTFYIFKDEGDDQVTVTASNAVSATWGVHYYLKNYCNCHVSWDGDQLRLPDALPFVNVTKSSSDRFRYYQNVCTSSYSFVWWNWTRWEREIDWMALNGVNLALAFTAQEAIWQRVYDGLGMARTGFTGPAFLAWNRMGNIRNFGRGLSVNWHEQSVKLQHLILNRMRELNIIPVLPAFSGIVPRSFKRKFPGASLLNITKWNNFSDEFCCPYLLSPEDPMFSVISRIFLREYILEFGTNHIYNCDTFNENNPPLGDEDFLSAMSRAVYEGIIQMDPIGIWMIQGWMFIHPFWSKERVKAFVTSVPIGKMLVLDLQSDLTPQYENFDSYFGQPFIWCTLHNFGGQLGIYGHLDLVNEGIVQGRNFENSTMVGIGITPEGIDQNYVMYEFTLESALRDDVVNVTEWVSSYARRRYGLFDVNIDKAWFILRETAYNYNPESAVQVGRIARKKSNYSVHISKNILTKRPSLTMSEMIWYRRTEMLKAFEFFVEASKNPELSSSELFRHDFIDVTRQVIQLAVGSLYGQLMSDYVTNNSDHFQSTSRFFLEILDDLEGILRTGRKFLLGNWLRDAKSVATDLKESQQYEYNARNQITLWGPKGEIKDYAAKQWSGLIADYYTPRWTVFVSALNKSLMENVSYDSSAVRGAMFNEVEMPFTLSRKEYPVNPEGDTLRIIGDFSVKWIKALKEILKG